MNPALSIIVPAHNNRETLPRLLESIARQDLSLETIVVDDDSRVPCHDLIKEYQAQGMELRLICPPRRVYTKEARLIGIEAARGEIITFADADDEIYGKEGLKDALAKFQECRPDLLHVSTVDMAVGMKREILWLAPVADVLRDGNVMRAFALPFYRFNVWGKFYRRELWLRLLPQARAFPVQRFCEDMFLFFLYALYAKSYVGYPVPVYGYHFAPENAHSRAVGRMFATDMIRQYFIPLMREQECPEDLIQIFDDNLANHTALQATRWLHDFSLTPGHSDVSSSFLAKGVESMKNTDGRERISEHDLLRILLASNARLANALTGMINPSSRLVAW